MASKSIFIICFSVPNLFEFVNEKAIIVPKYARNSKDARRMYDNKSPI